MAKFTYAELRYIELVSKALDLNPALILRRRRFQYIVKFRQFVAYLFVYKLDYTTIKTAKLLEYKNHSSVIHAIKEVRVLEDYPHLPYAKEWELIKNKALFYPNSIPYKTWNYSKFPR